MHLRAEAVILSVRQHGEHHAVVRALTHDHGLLAGYVRGGRSSRIRPILQPANVVRGEWRARTEDQLAGLTVELIRSRAPLYAEPLPAAALEWVTVLTANALPEGQPYPRIAAALEGVIGAIEAAPSARCWAVPLARYEAVLLAGLGYGLEGVPSALLGEDEPDARDLFAAFGEVGNAIERNVLTDRRGEALVARARLIERLKRAIA